MTLASSAEPTVRHEKYQHEKEDQGQDQENQMDRRRFLTSMAAAGAVAMVADGVAPSVADAQAVSYSGADLSGWRTVLGDGIWTGPGQGAPSTADLRASHLGSHSLLEANIHERGVMAHNITFDRFTASDGMTRTHRASTEFRIPTVPTVADWTYNSQTLEIGVFVWDGVSTRSDYGLAIQWVLNPWVAEFGQIRAWSMTESGPEWISVDYLEPDTEWHTFNAVYRPGGAATVRLDSKDNITIAETVTLKDPSWGATVDARFQMEIVSVWPGANPSVPSHAAEFRNWAWRITA